MAKEIQKQIIENSDNGFVTEDEFYQILKVVAPGTNFRAALDGALRVGKGALIVMENSHTSELFDGGFRINSKFTPQKIIELTKMDGAIILSDDLKKISYANVLLTPSSKIKTIETGTRHKAAERTAKQARTLAIAISERRQQITLYYKNLRYSILATGELLRRANEHLQLLEKQRELFDKSIEKLTQLELNNFFNLKQAINVIQKGKLIQRIAKDLKRYSVELGYEATLLKIRLREITLDVDKETDLVIKDYTNLNLKKSKAAIEDLTYDEIFSENKISKSLNYEALNSPGSIKGWRILSKTSLVEAEIALILKNVKNINEVLNSDQEYFENLLNDKELAKNLREQIDKLKANY